MGGECGTDGRGYNSGFRGKRDGNRPLERPKRKWEDNIKMNLKDIGCGGSGI